MIHNNHVMAYYDDIAQAAMLGMVGAKNKATYQAYAVAHRFAEYRMATELLLVLRSR